MRVAITDFVASFPVSGGRARLGPSSSLNQLEISPFEGVGDSFAVGARLRQGVPVAAERLGVVAGSSKGDLHALAQWSDHQCLRWTPDFKGSQVPCAVFLSPNAACATGAHVLALGAQLIQNGRVDVAFCEAIEPPQHPLILAAYRNMGALSKTDKMRPFDAKRDGFVPGWGAGSLLLESEEHARNRGAQIHGFLSGYSLKCDSSHMTSMHPSGDGITRAIDDALQNAGQPNIDYINAHGTATINDRVESLAINAVFGKKVPISSTKPLTGHLLGAAGAVEAIISLLAVKENFAPPTLNLHEPDTGLDLDYIPLRGRKMTIKTVLSLNYGFGGHIGVLVLEKF